MEKKKISECVCVCVGNKDDRIKSQIKNAHVHEGNVHTAILIGLDV